MATTKAPYIILRGQVYRREEKEPFVSSGKSILGALEYDRETDALRCHECGRWRSYLGNHIARDHPHLTTREYKSKHGLTAKHSLLGENAYINLRNRSNRTPPPGMNAMAEYMQAVKRGEKPKPRQKRGRSGWAAWRNERNICKEQCLFRLQRIVIENERVPFRHELPNNLGVNLAQYFGGLHNALKLLGIEANKPVYTEDVLIESLRDFYVLNQRLPLRQEWGTGRLASVGTYQNHFGSISASYEAAGLALVAKETRRTFALRASVASREALFATPERLKAREQKRLASRRANGYMDPRDERGRLLPQKVTIQSADVN